MRTALVTGSAGFVGRHMVWALHDQGYHVFGIDIADGHDAVAYFNHFDAHYDLVVHCAAVVGGRTMIDGEPLRLAVEDLAIDAALFRWALRTRPGRIVAFSSSAAYPTMLQGREHHVRLEERHIGRDFPAGPDQTYGWVKLTLERLAAEAELAGIRTHVFRPFSGYGSDQDDAYPFPAIIRRAASYRPATLLADERPFLVWGDPDSARDWVHIDDVVRCVLAAIDADDVGPMNICTGIATTFGDLARLVLAELGHVDVEVEGDVAQPTGVFWRVGDPTRMRQVYTPRICLAEGVERAVKELNRVAA